MLFDSLVSSPREKQAQANHHRQERNKHYGNVVDFLYSKSMETGRNACQQPDQSCDKQNAAQGFHSRIVA
ncbi:MAG TPA: hypothetical protein VMJ32_01585 [Pirellulales bacterium]|nr:hypothetical protein [Pirellulales bacterium]